MDYCEEEEECEAAHCSSGTGGAHDDRVGDRDLEREIVAFETPAGLCWAGSEGTGSARSWARVR